MKFKQPFAKRVDFEVRRILDVDAVVSLGYALVFNDVFKFSFMRENDERQNRELTFEHKMCELFSTLF